MQLCLVRHAIAEERGLRWPDDSLRPLTAEGRVKMEAAARGLATLWKPDAIITSPYTRAVQTAQILARVTGAPVVSEVRALTTGEHDKLFVAARRTGAVRVAAVGHEPLMGEALSYALCGDADRMSAVFKKGAAALIGFVDEPVAGRGWLEWHMQPAWLRALAPQPPA
jgi:phosphohistidine phosphatase